VLPRGTPVLLPSDLVEGFDAQTVEVEVGFPTALFGEGYLSNDWRYYPWSLLTKTSIGGLVLLLLAVISFLYRRPRKEETTLIVFFLSVAATIVLAGRIDVGLRYLLPVYPAAIILMGRVAAWPRLRAVAIAATAAIAMESVAVAPRHHSFVNVVARPWKQWVPDLDWGQSLIDLRRWINANRQGRISTVYFGTALPAAYGINAVSPMDAPLTPYVAISRQALHGLPVKTPDGFVFVRCWKSLRAATPVADLGGILIYRASDIANAAEQPPIAPGGTWQTIIDDPELVPFRDRDVILQRIGATRQPTTRQE
jgi:hypothetical protein